MNDRCCEIGWQSINKTHEELCGDHVDVLRKDNRTVVVLADGLGSGVKANILSTLTAKILSTMIAEGMSVEECVATVASTLPVCEERHVAYSTFTVARIENGTDLELIQYDNPEAVLLRDNKNYDYPREERLIGGKRILYSHFSLREEDTLVFFSDGAIHAGIGMTLNFGWQRPEIIAFLESRMGVNFTSKTLTTMLVEECNSLYGGMPGDDTTVCTIRIRQRRPLNLLFGPPADPDDNNRMMALFFAKEGSHIVCGGTTSSIAARYLHKPVTVDLDFPDPKIPPISKIEGVDLVTEGIITINKVLSYAKDYLADNGTYAEWSCKKDGASQIARLLFEDATDINFYVGRAINPAHQNPDLPINFSIKMRLIEELAECLKQMGKNIKISYF